ncbi:D-tyrosyl-tRNA(Tyr) deacylase [candidate division KSB1 bacterium]|nr:D-tyrosyl-tRNA(Tyr) deacylase [candidate division KSB1 bacterium]
MLAVLQRVKKAAVSIDGKVVGQINRGLVVLLGIRTGDSEDDIPYLANKCANLRIFEDENSKFNRSVTDVGGAFLVVSQFTLFGDTRKGRRPSFSDAAPPEIAEPLYHKFVTYLRNLGFNVATGEFGAMMLVEIHNDGPVTVMVRSKGELVG